VKKQIEKRQIKNAYRKEFLKRFLCPIFFKINIHKNENYYKIHFLFFGIYEIYFKESPKKIVILRKNNIVKCFTSSSVNPNEIVKIIAKNIFR